jgi:hypothetical protein
MAEEGEEAVPPAAATVVGEEDAAAGEAPAPAVDYFGLPAELVSVLPSDPFAQLDVARRITSIALSHRLGLLEAEAARLRSQLAERDAEAEDLRERVEQLDAALAVATGRGAAEAALLRSQLAERDAEAEDLRERVEQLAAALAVATGRLRRAEEEKVIAGQFTSGLWVWLTVAELCFLWNGGFGPSHLSPVGDSGPATLAPNVVSIPAM